MLIIAPDKKTAEELGGTDAKFHSQFLREETEFLIPAKRGLAAIFKGGEGSGENEGHPFRGNQWTTGQAGDVKPKPTLQEKPKREWRIDRTLNERAERALNSHVPLTMRVRRGATSVQQQVADAIPHAANIPGTRPFDVRIGEGKDTKHLIEVKSIWKAKNDKVTVHPPARRRKEEELAKFPKAKPSMIIVDEREKPAKVYYREGIGSFRFGGMTYLGKKHGDKMDTVVLKRLVEIYGGKK